MVSADQELLGSDQRHLDHQGEDQCEGIRDDEHHQDKKDLERDSSQILKLGYERLVQKSGVLRHILLLTQLLFSDGPTLNRKFFELFTCSNFETEQSVGSDTFI